MTDRAPEAWKDAVRDRRLRIILRFLAFIFIIAAGLYATTPLLPATAGFFRLMPFLSNSVVKVSILAALCLYAAADLPRRHGLVLIVIIGHLLSVIAMLVMPALIDVHGMVYPPGVDPLPLGALLLRLSLLDGVITVILIVAYWPVRKRYLVGGCPPTAPGWPAPPEQVLRRVLQVLALGFLIAAVGYEVGPLWSPGFFVEVPFVTNSVVKVGTLAMTAWYVSRNMSQRMSLVGPLILVHVISVVVQGVYLLGGGAALDLTYDLAGRTMSMRSVLAGAIVLDGLMALLLALLYQAAWRSRVRTKFLRPLEYRTLTAIAEIMVGTERPALPPEDIARNVDEHLAVLRTERRILFRVLLVVVYYLPVLALRAPLAEMARPIRQRFLKYYYYRDAAQRWWQWYFALVQLGTRVAHQLTALGYYNDPRAHKEIGYQRFTDRGPPPQPIERPDKHLKVVRPWDVPEEVIDEGYDVCIVGTGAGGATAGYALAEAGMKVLLVERGQYIESRHFTENELYQICTLYDRGMLQVAEDFKFSVLQGNCVGGSTTVNNAICFDPPPSKLADWHRAERRLRIADIQDAAEWLRHFMQIRSLATVPHHRAAAVLDTPPSILVREDHGVAAPLPFDANIAIRTTAQSQDLHCYGCGNCNMGCGWNRKLSMLDHTLPIGQKDSSDKLHILAECEALRLRSVSVAQSRKRVSELVGRFSDGRRVTIRAKAFVVSAGAINSSYLLLRSGIGGVGSRVPVGRGLGFNMLTPVFAEFAEEMDSFRGIQMGHYLTEKDDRFIIETWFSPPIGLATAMGGWFEDHYANMRRAKHMVAYGMVVGTQSNGTVFRNLTGPGFRYRPAPADLERLRLGVRALGDMLFEAGATRIILNTWDHGSIWSRSALRQVDRYFAGKRTITVASSHPQGGNPIGGVVDHDLRVRDYDNLFIADASVFPTAIQVNPQLTVMAVARYGALRILNDRRS